MATAPTALNKRGNKVRLDDYTFDSQKEADFYIRFVKFSGCPYKVHPHYVLQPKTEINGFVIRQLVYTPDVVIFDRFASDAKMLHVYDVKNSLGPYGIDAAAKLRFRLFAAQYGIPVEAVVIRTHDFKTIAQGVTKARKQSDPADLHGF